MNRFAAGILDLDGVVVDSEALHLEATKIVFGEHGLPIPEDGVEGFVGRTDFDIFTEAIRRSSAVVDVVTLLEKKNRVYSEITDRMEMIPGALEFIRRLAASELRLGLATSSVRLNQARAFALFDLAGYFDVVVTADDVSRTKPDPEPYRVAAERLSVAPASCFVVEDSFNGAKSASGAGCHVIGLTSSFPADRLRLAGATVTFDSFDDIARYLGFPSNA